MTKSINKNLIKILKITINDHQRNWYMALLNSLSTNRVTLKSSIDNYPFFIVYGQEVKFPTHVCFPSLYLSQSIQNEACPILQQSLDMLLKLKEERENSKRNLMQHQEVMKKMVWYPPGAAQLASAVIWSVMFDEASSSNPPDLPVPAEGAYVWHLEVIVVAVGIDPVSREYETGPVVDSTSHTKKKKTWKHCLQSNPPHSRLGIM